MDLAERGWTVTVVGRDRDRGESLTTKSSTLSGDIRFHRTDLATQSAVRSLADDVRDRYGQLDALVHNAGLSSSDRVETTDGVERTMAVNFLAPYLLTHELIDIVRSSSPARIVTTGSELHRRAELDMDDFQFECDYDALQAYARSKLALVAFSLELADRLPDERVTVNSFHPGFVPSTNLFRDASLLTRVLVRAAGMVPGVGTRPRTGGERLVRLVTVPTFGDQTGTYVTGDGIVPPSDEASDPATRTQVWEHSATLVGVEPDWPSVSE